MMINNTQEINSIQKSIIKKQQKIIVIKKIIIIKKVANKNLKSVIKVIKEGYKNSFRST